MDRTPACGAGDVGSIPTESTNGFCAVECVLSTLPAPVVQWIEYLPPKEVVQVRFLPGAPRESKKEPHGLFFALFPFDHPGDERFAAVGGVFLEHALLCGLVYSLVGRCDRLDRVAFLGLADALHRRAKVLFERLVIALLHE